MYFFYFEVPNDHTVYDTRVQNKSKMVGICMLLSFL